MQSWRDRQTEPIGLVGVIPGAAKLVSSLALQDGLHMPLICDPEYRWHAWLGLGQFSLFQFFRPKVIAKYIFGILKGIRIAKAGENAELLRQGGEVLFTSDCRAIWVYRSNDPTDRPTEQSLADAVVII